MTLRSVQIALEQSGREENGEDESSKLVLTFADRRVLSSQCDGSPTAVI
jgi:hypothetical protein